MRKLFYAILVATIALTTVSSCKKDKKSTNTTTAPAGALVLWPNVHVVDSTQWILFVNSIHPANGIYMYTFTPSTPNISVNKGDIIVGASNGGYIRKVTSVVINGGYYELQTSQATMADVFKSGSFNFQIPVNDPQQGTAGVTRSYTNFGIIRTSNFVLTLNGQFNIQPVCNFSFAFDSATGLTNFEMSTSNSVVNNNITFNLKGLMPSQKNADTLLGLFSTTNIQTVQAWTPAGNVTVPIPIKLNVSNSAKAYVFSPAPDTINTIINWTTSDIFTGGLQYQGSWQAIHNSVATNTVAFDTVTKNYNSNAQFTFTSLISSWFYAVSGPQISTNMSGDFVQVQTGNTAPFHHRTDLWSSGTNSQGGSPIYGHGIPVFSQSWASDSVFYQAPYMLTKVSGDNQSALAVHALSQPLIVKVTDSNGQPVINVTVTFAVASNDGGSLSAYTVITDQNGLAQTSWTLGPVIRAQTVTVNAYDGNRHDLSGAPAVFTATAQ